MASTYELIIKAVDQSSRPIDKISKSLDDLDRKSAGISNTLKAAGGALAAFATGSVLRTIVQTTARFEDLQDTLVSVTGSAKAGADAFKFVQDFATRTQFGVEDLTTTFIKLQGAGIEPTEKLLTTFTDTAAVTTDQLGTLEAMADLFSRTTAGGLGLEELNRLADRGVPVFRILEEQLGLTRLEISNFGKSAEGAAKIRAALQVGLNESFGGATAGKLDNLSTAMSNFGIAVLNAANTVGTEFRPQLTEAINDATNFITTHDALLKSIGSGLGDAVVVLSSSVKVLADNIYLVRDAALAYMGLKLLGNIQTTIAKFNSFSAGAKSAAAAMGPLQKALSSTFTGRAVMLIAGLPKMFMSAGQAVLGYAAALARAATLSMGITAATGGIAGAFARVGLVATTTITRIAALAPLLVNPYVLAGAAIAAAFAGAMGKIGQLAADSVGFQTTTWEVLRAYWFRFTSWLGEAWTNAMNAIGNIGSNVFQSVSSFFTNIAETARTRFSELTEFWRGPINAILRTAKEWANNTIAIFVFAFNSIKETFLNLPNIFVAIFNGIKRVVTEFGSAFVSKMANVGEAAIMALKAPFTDATLGDAIALATRETFGNLNTVVSEELAKIGQTTPDYGRIAGEAFATDYVGAAGNALSAGALYIGAGLQEISNTALEYANATATAVTDTWKGIGTDVQATVEAYRAHNDAIAAAADSQLYYEDAIIRVVNAQNAEAAAAAAAAASNDTLTNSVSTATQSLTSFEQYYRDLLNSSAAAVTSQTNMALAVRQLKIDLDNGRISLDQYAQAMASLNQVSVPTFDQQLQTARDRIGTMELEKTTNAALAAQLQTEGYTRQQLVALGLVEAETRRAGAAATATQLTASQQIAQQLGEEKTRWENLNATLADTSAIDTLAQKYGVAADTIRRELAKARDSITTFKDNAVTVGGIVSDTWQQMSQNMASGIAQGIMSGKGAFNSFKDFLKDFANQVLTQILQKMLIQPMVNQMSNWFGGTNFAVPTISQQFGGLFGGGGGGGLFSGLFGGGGGFLSGLFGGIGNFFSGIFGGIGSIFGFADGGMPPVNKPSIVGERGPELFVPSSVGTVVPNEQLGGNLSVTFQINAIDTQTGTEFVLAHKKEIEGIIQNAYNRRGKEGIY